MSKQQEKIHSEQSETGRKQEKDRKIVSRRFVVDAVEGASFQRATSIPTNTLKPAITAGRIVPEVMGIFGSAALLLDGDLVEDPAVPVPVVVPAPLPLDSLLVPVLVAVDAVEVKVITSSTNVIMEPAALD